jgi:hypothetical protein
LSYSNEHLRRLRLIRVLIDVGGLSVTAVKDALAAIDAPDLSTFKVLGKGIGQPQPTRRAGRRRRMGARPL